ncbi:Sodium-dependent phosphate transporter 2 [Taenia crassiceps]|uniref:Phosphate transporter n=1 Tax=Taenia crassiceps TaxID=6207 RepID=A0ABR4QM53_9CEST
MATQIQQFKGHEAAEGCFTSGCFVAPMLVESELLLVVVGFMVAFMLAFGLGANDVANSFGTSVGSKVLTLQMACILATICEISGSVLLGGHVSATVRGGIIDPTRFNGTEDGPMRLMQGQVSSLCGACLWMLLATFLKIPVSATHSIVGATAGFGLVLFGFQGVQWTGILKIVISWFVSPVLSGLVSGCLFLIIKYVVLVKEQSLEPALNTLPFLYGVTIIINVFSVLYGGLHLLSLPEIPLWLTLVVSFSSGIVAAIIVFFFVRPIIRRRVQKRLELMASGKWDPTHKDPKHSFCNRIRNGIRSVFRKGQTVDGSVCTDEEKNKTGPSGDGEIGDTEIQALPSNDAVESAQARTSPSDAVSVTFSEENRSPDGQVYDRPEEAQVFAFAQILTATFGSFVHGGNDVSNAIGPVIGLWIVSTTGNVLMTAKPAVWILFYGGVGISVGLWIWGRKVMETIGTDLTVITPSSGMCIELGAAITVLIASKAGLPISTTHCLVGSVVLVGFIRSKMSVNWRLFVNIILAWVVTLPAAGGLSALIMYIFTKHA